MSGSCFLLTGSCDAGQRLLHAAVRASTDTQLVQLRGEVQRAVPGRRWRRGSGADTGRSACCRARARRSHTGRRGTSPSVAPDRAGRQPAQYRPPHPLPRSSSWLSALSKPSSIVTSPRGAPIAGNSAIVVLDEEPLPPMVRRLSLQERNKRAAVDKVRGRGTCQLGKGGSKVDVEGDGIHVCAGWHSRASHDQGNAERLVVRGLLAERSRCSPRW